MIIIILSETCIVFGNKRLYPQQHQQQQKEEKKNKSLHKNVMWQLFEIYYNMKCLDYYQTNR